MVTYKEGKIGFNKNEVFIQSIFTLLVYNQMLVNVFHWLVFFYFTNKKFLCPGSMRKSAWKSVLISLPCCEGFPCPSASHLCKHFQMKLSYLDHDLDGLLSTQHLQQQTLVARKIKLVKPGKPRKKSTFLSYLLIKTRCGAVNEQA